MCVAAVSFCWEKSLEAFKEKRNMAWSRKMLSALTSQWLWHLFYRVFCAEYVKQIKRGSLFFLQIWTPCLCLTRGAQLSCGCCWAGLWTNLICVISQRSWQELSVLGMCEIYYSPGSPVWGGTEADWKSCAGRLRVALTNVPSLPESL